MIVRQILEVWRRVETVAACALLLALVTLILTQITLRAVATPLKWAEEAGVYLFIWMIFLGAGAAYKEFQHVRIGALDALGDAARRHSVLFANIVVIAVCAILIWQGPSIVALEWNSSTTSLPYDVPRALVYSVPLIYACCSIIVTAIAFLFIGVPQTGIEDEVAI